MTRSSVLHLHGPFCRRDRSTPHWRKRGVRVFLIFPQTRRGRHVPGVECRISRLRYLDMRLHLDGLFIDDSGAYGLLMAPPPSIPRAHPPRFRLSPPTCTSSSPKTLRRRRSSSSSTRQPAHGLAVRSPTERRGLRTLTSLAAAEEGFQGCAGQVRRASRPPSAIKWGEHDHVMDSSCSLPR